MSNIDALEVCSKHKNCSLCVRDPRCGFCINENRCVPGSFLGAEFAEFCPHDTDLTFRYHQCMVSPSAEISIISGIILVLLLSFTIGILWRCQYKHRIRKALEQDEENESLLRYNDRKRRSISYYQWNRTPQPVASSSVASHENSRDNRQNYQSINRKGTKDSWDASIGSAPEDVYVAFGKDKVDQLKQKFGK
ncbi:uncharacterized protein VTP21DRAFT_6722 [Calcarisporiella thermophila]|uniref:uncharacterized protein n=1 Tax=Calcarisporiella thermophila TaxID=911321 RepID=UPI00374325BB